MGFSTQSKDVYRPWGFWVNKSQSGKLFSSGLLMMSLEGRNNFPAVNGGVLQLPQY